MFFLLRVAFWLTIVLALLPSGSSQPGMQTKVAATDAMVAAGAAVSDMSSFCDRQPEACVVGAQTAIAIGQRAQAGARMVYEFINQRVVQGENQTENQAKNQGQTGSVPERKAEAARDETVPLPHKDPRR